jgi:2'-5' RNA ligase
MAAEETSRVFFALWPDGEARRSLDTLARDCALRTGGRAPDAANLHLTLAFIGEASAQRVAMLREIGKSAAASLPPFTLTLDRIGAFRKQDIAWVGPAQENPPIRTLADYLYAQLTAAGFELERRPFHAHVTLARRARMPDPMRNGAWAPIVWNVSRLTLAASTHAQGVLRYVAIDAWPLAGAERPGR